MKIVEVDLQEVGRQNDLNHLKACPACRYTDISPFYQATGKRQVSKDREYFSALGFNFFLAVYALCKQCGLLFLNPRWDSKTLERLYGEENIFRKVATQLFLANGKWQQKVLNVKRRVANKEDYYDMLGGLFDSSRDQLPENHLFNLRWLLKQSGASRVKSAMDLGCGTGNAEAVFKKFDIDYCGVEASPDLVDKAQFWGRKVVCADYQNFSQEWIERWDLIYTNHFLEHLDDPVHCLKLLRPYLKDRGYLFIAVPTVNFLASNFSMFLQDVRCASTYMNWRHMSHFYDVSLRNAVGLAGYRSIAWKYHKETILLLAQKETTSVSSSIIKPRPFLIRLNVYYIPFLLSPFKMRFFQRFYHFFPVLKSMLWQFFRVTGLLPYLRNLREGK